jgi:hypothetical protein
LRLQKNALQTVEYMYRNSIITGDDLRHFWKLGDTLEIAARNRFQNDILEFWENREHAPARTTAILNEENPAIDSRFDKG